MQKQAFKFKRQIFCQKTGVLPNQILFSYPGLVKFFLDTGLTLLYRRTQL